MIKNIVFIGAGNLATQLALVLKKAKFNITQVYSRTKESAETLAKQIDADFCFDYAKVNHDADLYIFALSDKALPSALKALQLKDKILVHTAGSLPMLIFEAYTTNYGVFIRCKLFQKPVKWIFLIFQFALKPITLN